MNSTRTCIALDASLSSIRLRLSSPDGFKEVVGPGVRTDLPLEPQWAAAVRRLLDAHPDQRPSCLSVGSNAVEKPDPLRLLHLLADTSLKRVTVAGDAITTYLGTLGDQIGAVIAANIGTVCFAMGKESVARVDGWGHLLGDAGSAYWIGRTGLEAALRGYDGRRQMTALTGMLQADFPDLDQAYATLQADPDRVTRIASYAAKVEELSESDRVAANILDKAAAHLSEAVQAALRRVGLMGVETPHVVATGTVFAYPRVMSRFIDYLTLQWPNFALVEPVGTRLDGTVALATLDDSHPLIQHVFRAERS